IGDGRCAATSQLAHLRSRDGSRAHRLDAPGRTAHGFLQQKLMDADDSLHDSEWAMSSIDRLTMRRISIVVPLADFYPDSRGTRPIESRSSCWTRILSSCG